MAGNTGNIFIETDFDNIFSVDPNKVYDQDGKVVERLVNHEELVMYVNLECNVLPRTKLIVGEGANEKTNVVTIATSKINFLNPGNKNSLDTSWTDSFTGKNKLNGDNQSNIGRSDGKISNRNEAFETNQSRLVDGIQGSSDSGLLGITSVQYKVNSAFLPSVTMTLEDVRGRALFESGDQSVYAAFFNMPYPLFYLTMKGYYGKAIKTPLILQTFNASFNSTNGNFQINLTFYAYKYSMISEIPSEALVAIPHMYEKKFVVSPIDNTNSNNTTQELITTTRGYELIESMYSKYESKGLIPPNFPRLTVMELIYKLETFQTDLLTTLDQQDLTVLNDIKAYEEMLLNFNKEVKTIVGTTNPSWFFKYADTTNKNTLILVKEEGDEFQKKLYFLKQGAAGFRQEFENSKRDIGKIINTFTETAKSIPTFKDLDFKFSEDDFYYSPPSTSDTVIDWPKTYEFNKNIKFTTPTDPDYISFRTNISKTILQYNSGFDGNGDGYPSKLISTTINDNETSYDKKYFDLTTQFQEKKEEELNKVAERIRKYLKDPTKGLGFDPNIRNIVAILFASLEAFIMKMNEVHTEAWKVRDEPVRKSLLKDSTTDPTIAGDPVFPWPQIVEVNTKEKQETYTLKYPGDYLSGRDATIWPEVKFVEEFSKGVTQRTTIFPSGGNKSNQQTGTGLASITALDFPVSDRIYLNKDEVKFFYEIWERVFLLSFYTNLSKTNDGSIYKSLAEYEVNNILKALGGTSYSLKNLMKNYKFSSSNFVSILKQFSNEGLGQSWQLFIREQFNTDYVENELLTQSNILTNDQISLSQTTFLGDSEQNLTSFLISSKTNKFDFMDLYPFRFDSWTSGNTEGGISNAELANSTSKTIFLNKKLKTITNFPDDIKPKTNSICPVTNFNYVATKPIDNNNLNLDDFYSERETKKLLPTEGELFYSKITSNFTQSKTTSILNSPMFVNSILTGLNSERLGVTYPYVSAAYFFLNSLPLATLRETYKSYNNNSTDRLDYIYAGLKKFSGIHNLPYAWILKYGSIWHRYKTNEETNIDIISNDWNNFDYTSNYDPLTLNNGKSYNLNVPQPDGTTSASTIILQTNISVSNYTNTIINLGFYPNLINEFNYFYQGSEIIPTTYTDPDINAILGSKLILLDYKASNITPTINPIIRGTNFDQTNTGRTLTITTWSCLSLSSDGTKCFVLPSFGTKYNETVYECFNSENLVPFKYDKLKIEVENNPNMYNGSVRLMWSSPNYGYFNLDDLSFPTPDKYIKYVSPLVKDQSNFNLNDISYSSIEDLFSVFDKKTLDVFEQEFLNFCRPATDSINGVTNQNFQMFMRQLMTIDKPVGNDTNDVLQDAISKQNSQFYTLIEEFMGQKKYLKLGNPLNFNRWIFYSFSNTSSSDPSNTVPFDKYGYNSYQNDLPPTIPLFASISTNSQAWADLRTYVGFSDDPLLTYKDAGSFITDFFIDMNVEFNSQNVKNLSSLIKLYATQKLLDTTLDQTKFVNILTNYLTETGKFRDGVIDALFQEKKLLDALGTDISNKQGENQIDIEQVSNQSVKVELWELFKAVNDKWIAGNNFEDKTFFEDLMFVDRASRDISEDIIVDIFKLTSTLKGSFKESTNGRGKNLLAVIESVIKMNNFVIMPIPGYVNFYGIQTPIKDATPIIEPPTESANSLFGTYTEVDTRKSAPKMVCFYANKPSEHLQIDKQGYLYKNDSFDFNNQSQNPMRSTPKEGQNLGLSNKVVGFTVDVGIRNQNIFQNISLNQTPGKATSESLNMLNQLGNQANQQGVSTASVSLYNIYKTRSYGCEISMMGNAMIQPTMYFNLRHVPMFNGPYLITDVQHNISPGVFETKIVGVRQPLAVLGNITKDEALVRIKSIFLSEVNKQLLTVQNNKTTTPNSTTGGTQEQQNQTTTDNLQNTNEQTPTQNQDCSDGLYGVAKSYVTGEKIQTTISTNELASNIKTKTTNANVRKVLFSLIYMKSADSTGALKAYNYNFVGLQLNNNIDIILTSNQDTRIKKEYICMETDSYQYPYASFVNNFSSLDIAFEKLKPIVETIQTTMDAKAVLDTILKYWPVNSTETIEQSNPTTYQILLSRVTKAINIGESIDLFVEAQTGSPQVPPIDLYNVTNYKETYTSSELVTFSLKPESETNGKWEVFAAETYHGRVEGGGSSRGSRNESDKINAAHTGATLNPYDFITKEIFDEEDPPESGTWFINFELIADPRTPSGGYDSTSGRKQNIKVFNFKVIIP